MATGNLKLSSFAVKRDGFGLASRAVSFARNTQWPQAIHILSQARHSSLRINLFLASACARSYRLWIHSYWLLRRLRDVQQEPDAHVYATVEAALAKASQWSAGVHMLDVMGHAGMFKTMVALNTAAHAAATKVSDHWPGALQLLFGSSTKLQPDVVSFVVQMTACGHALNWSACLQGLQALSWSAGPVTCIARNAAASCFTQSSAWSFTLELFSDPGPCLVTLDAVGSNTLILTLGKTMSWQGASEVLASMCCQRISPTLVTLNSLLNVFARCERWAESLLAMSQLQTAATSARANDRDDVSFGTTMAACERAQSWQRSLDLLSRSSFAFLQPDATSVNTAISASVRGLLWQCAVALLSTLRGDASQHASFGACLTAASLALKWSMALSLLSRMRLHSLRQDPLSLLPAVLSLGGRWRMAVCLAAGAADTTAGCPVATWTSVAEAAGRAPEMPRMPALLEQVSERLGVFLQAKRRARKILPSFARACGQARDMPCQSRSLSTCIRPKHVSGAKLEESERQKP